MGPGERILIAHDLPMSLAEAAEEMGKLGEGWYLPRDPHAQIEELLADGHVQLEREGPERIYAYLQPKDGGVLTAEGKTVTEALLNLYVKVRDGA